MLLRIIIIYLNLFETFHSYSQSGIHRLLRFQIKWNPFKPDA